MEKLDVGCLCEHWECGAGDDLSRLQRGPTTASEELDCSESSRRRLYRRIEREAGRRIVARRLIGCNRAAQSASVSHCRVSDVADQTCQNRQMFTQHGRASNLSMRCSRPDGDCTITELDLFGDNANDVYETG